MKFREMRSEVATLKNGLYNICNLVNLKTNVLKVCEIGSYLGESTVIFAKNFKNCKEFITVDPYSLSFNTDGLFNQTTAEQIYNQFLENIKPYPFIKHIKKSSVEASKEFSNEYFDFIYIDGCHQYESVLADIKHWKEKVKPGGFISFHDIDNFFVKKAIQSNFNIDDGFITVDNSITFQL